jgi:hypothetical protein
MTTTTILLLCILSLMSEALNDPIVRAAHDRNRALRERYVSAPCPPAGVRPA